MVRAYISLVPRFRPAFHHFLLMYGESLEMSLVPRSSHCPVFDRWGLPHSLDKMDQAFPLHFCILQAIENWMMGRPGSVATDYNHTICN